MRHANGKYDLSVDDIHDIRVENSKMTESMPYEELKKYYDNAVKKFFENSPKDEVLV